MVFFKKVKTNDTTKQIASLNDTSRKSLRSGWIVHMQEIAVLLLEDQKKIIEKVRLFDNFSEANDTYGEHDFGSIECEVQKVLPLQSRYGERQRRSSRSKPDDSGNDNHVYS